MDDDLMNSRKFSINGPFLIALGSALAAIASGGLTYWFYLRAPASCVAGINNPACHSFVPYLWVCLAALTLLLLDLGFILITKKRWYLLAVFFALLMGIILAYQIKQWRSNIPGPASFSTNNLQRYDGPQVKVAGQSVGNLSPVSDTGIKYPFPNVPLSRKNLPLDGDPFDARSKAEQDWLDRNGYPNAEQMSAYSTASDIELREAAKSGDRAAEAIYNGRRIAAGDESAVDDLMEMSAKGSNFALDILAAQLASQKQDAASRSLAYSISRVSELRGNYRSAASRDLLFDSPLTQFERMEAEQDASEIFQSLIVKSQQLRGGQISPVDPRPVGP